MKLSHKQTWIILVGLMLFGYFVRVLHVADQSIWGDEAFTYVVLHAENFWVTLARDVHPPLYFMLMKVWTGFAGISELSLRFPSVLASTIGLALMVVFAKEAIRHRPPMKTQFFIPLIALLLLTLADLDIQISQEARSYTLHLVWILLSFIAYLKWLRTEKNLWAIVFIFSNALIVYTHYIGVFTPFALGFHALFFLRGKQRIFAFGMLVCSALLVIPWVLIVLAQQVEKFAGDAVPAFPSTWGTLWALRTSWFTKQWVLMLGLALLGIISLESSNIKIRPFRTTSLLLIVIIVPVALGFWSNLYLPTLFDYRIAQITPALMLLMAFGLANFQRMAQIFFIIVIIVYGIFSVDVYRPKEPWRESAQLVAEYAQADDAILLDFTGGDYTMDYYLERYLLADIPTASMWQWRTFEPETYESGILGYLDSYDTIWLARWSSTDEAFIKLGATNHIPTMRRTLIDGGYQLEVYRFDRFADESVLATFENGMLLQTAEIENGQVDLWWSTNAPLANNFTVSVKVLNAAGEVIAQTDHQPQLDLRPTSTWQPDEIIYDPYHIEQTGTSILVQVYLWTPGGIQPVRVDNNFDGFTLLFPN